MVQEKARGVGGGEGIAGRFSSPDLQSQSRPTSTGSKAGTPHTVHQFSRPSYYSPSSVVN